MWVETQGTKDKKRKKKKEEEKKRESRQKKGQARQVAHMQETPMRSQPKIWFLDWPSSDLFFQPHGIWVGRDGTLEAAWAAFAGVV